MEILENGTGDESFGEMDPRWIEEENRSFSTIPRLSFSLDSEKDRIDNRVWLELSQFVIEDLKWLLSLEHHKFWSHFVYSREACKFLISILRESPPHYVRISCLLDEEIRHAFEEIEHLVFLIFIRLSTKKESKHCFVKNLGEILYDNYLFTVPVMLDLCLFYGLTNSDLAKSIVGRVLESAPSFMSDFREMVPHFFHVLHLSREQFLTENMPKAIDANSDMSLSEMLSPALFLYDSVATVQIFLELHPKACKLFCTSEFVGEIVSFYSNVLPEMQICFERRQQDFPASTWTDLIDDIRMDFLRLVKGMFDFLRVQGGKESRADKREEYADEYLTLMLELLTEPTFLCDYDSLYRATAEIESLAVDCGNVDTVKLNHVLEGIRLCGNVEGGRAATTSGSGSERVDLEALVAEVKEILPHLNEDLVRESLKRLDHDPEKVIAAVLDGSPNFAADPPGSIPWGKSAPSIGEKNGMKGRNEGNLWKPEMAHDKSRYERWYYVDDDDYDDEYDDAYDDETSFVVAREEDEGRRPFVVPRALRQIERVENRQGEGDEEDDGEDEEDDEEEEEKEVKEKVGDNVKKDGRNREEGKGRDLVGRGRGRGQSKSVQRNRNFKESHKSFIGNHNRKREAGKKRNRGMIPF